MKIRIFSLLAIGAMLVASGGFAQSVDLSFETTDTNLIQSPTFSGSTGGISAATVDNNSATEANDRLDTSFGDTAGTTSLETGFTFDVDTAFVRQTDANDRHLLTDDSQGLGLYIKYDGAAGPMEISVTLREDPVNTGNNQIYEVTTYKILYGSQEWQYFYWDFATEILPTSSPDHWIPSLADGTLNGGDVGDAFAFEAMHYRPIPGVTSIGTPITTYVDDIHTGAVHTPTARLNPIDWSGFQSASVVLTEADMIAATGQSSIDYRAVYGGQGRVIYTYTETGSDSGAEPQLVSIDFNTTGTPIITTIATESQLAAGFTEGETTLEVNAIVKNGDFFYIGAFDGVDEIIAYDSGTTPTASSLVLADGLAGLELAPDGVNIIATYNEGFGAAAGTARVDLIDVGTGIPTTLVDVSAATAVTGEANFGPDPHALLASNGDLLIWDENFRSGGTGSSLLAWDGATLTTRKVGDSYEAATQFPNAAGIGISTGDVIFQFSEFPDNGGTTGLFIVEDAGSGATTLISRESISLAIDGSGSYTYGAANRPVIHQEPDAATVYLVDDNNGTIIALEFANVAPPPPAASTWNLYE